MPPRVQFASSTLIDHTSTTCIDNILESDVQKVSLNDHYMVLFIRKLNVSRGHTLVKTRNVKHFNEEAFVADVCPVDSKFFVNLMKLMKWLVISHQCSLQ